MHSMNFSYILAFIFIFPIKHCLQYYDSDVSDCECDEAAGNVLYIFVIGTYIEYNYDVCVFLFFLVRKILKQFNIHAISSAFLCVLF